MNERSMPLSMAAAGKKLMVTGFVAGFGLQKRLADMGLVPGADIVVMSGCHPGPLLVQVCGSRLGLGFGVAQKIMVKEAGSVEKTDYCRSGGKS